MSQRILTSQHLEAFRQYLSREEKSKATIEKYYRDAKAFLQYTMEQEVTKELAIEYKTDLQRREYAVRSINSMLASINSLLEFLGWNDCKVKTLRHQRSIYCAEEKELTKSEYLRLLEASKRKKQLHMIIQTICGTGIRVSELKYFTVEAVRKGEITVQCKSKTRTILIPGTLKKRLLSYAKEYNIKEGIIFKTRSDKPVDRSNLWSQMKKLSALAHVAPAKVFPHNLRKLFVRTFYKIDKDIAKLADILGHSSINTTRIYIMTTGTEHRKLIERLELVV